MLTKIKLTFHNLGLRSWIECDLCYNCPLSRAKGCCTYNPTFHAVDIAYIGAKQPDLLLLIINRPRVLVETTWISVNYLDDPMVGHRCQFNTDTGCSLPVEFRESVCRHFICPGIKMWEEESISQWADFIQELETTEAEFNQHLREKLKQAGVDLRSSFLEATAVLVKEYKEVLKKIEEERFAGYPRQEQVILEREISLSEKWVV